MPNQNQTYKPEYNLLSDAYLGPDYKFDKKLDYLAKIAQHESWSFKNSEETQAYPILYNYLNYTYDRAKQEGKISINDSSNTMCFNTGLQTASNNEDIYAFFIQKTNYDSEQQNTQRWYFVGFTQATDSRLQNLEPLPDIVDYFTNPSDFVYNKNLKIYLDYDHIIDDNFDRFQAIVDYDKHIVSAMLEKAVKDVTERLRRNYKIAVPQFYTDKYMNESKIQLLLPLCLRNPQQTDLALVVDKETTRYIGKTVLTLEWAYMNARRIVKPDVDWLKI